MNITIELSSINNISSMIPFCNICMGESDSNYTSYNITLSGIVLAIIGIIGIIGNCLVIIVYSQLQLRRRSVSIYLAALAMSDLCMICTAMFLFVLETWRHHGPPILAIVYGIGAPYVFPLGAMFQTTSVYFCVTAAVDCFISVVLPASVRRRLCTPQLAIRIVKYITIFSLIYNIPHCFELQTIDCIEPRFDYSHSLQICPTDFRQNILYYTIYYTYLYTVFLAVGPLMLLVILTSSVIYCVVVVRRRSPPPTSTSNNNNNDSSTLFISKPTNDDELSDTISLITVIGAFICANSVALLINFCEALFYEQMSSLIVYLVDASNLLVVCNCTANFFIYLIFGKTFRRTLVGIIYQRKQSPLMNTNINDMTTLWKRQSSTNFASPSIADESISYKLIVNNGINCTAAVERSTTV